MELEDLRRKYSGASDNAIHDPALKVIADGLFTGDRRRWPFEGVRTFGSVAALKLPTTQAMTGWG